MCSRAGAQQLPCCCSMLLSLLPLHAAAPCCLRHAHIRACRHGDRCSRLHNKPTISQTILIPNMYQNPVLNAPLGPDGIPVQVAPDEVMEHYEVCVDRQHSCLLGVCGCGGVGRPVLATRRGAHLFCSRLTHACRPPGSTELDVVQLVPDQLPAAAGCCMNSGSAHQAFAINQAVCRR